MNQLESKKFYTTKELISIFDKAIKFKHESIKLEKKLDKLSSLSTDMFYDISTFIEKRFKRIGNTSRNFAQIQLDEMSKQWSIMSASSVKVKHSINLNGFCSSSILYINSKYGIKEYKRFVRYNLFSYCQLNVNTNCNNKSFWFKEKRLTIKHQYRTDVLDFVVLQNIPQLDESKVNQLIELTRDIIWMIDSWRNFFKINIRYIKKINLIEHFSSNSRINDKSKEDIYKLDESIISKKKLFVDMTHQIARWELIINKWKEVNKNFLVLNQLRNSKLKI